MSLTFYAQKHVKNAVKQPVENEQQFKLLQKVDPFVADQAGFVTLKITDPNEDKE